MSSHTQKKPFDDVMYHRVVTFWKVVNFISVSIGVMSIPFILTLDGFWPLGTALVCVSLVLIGSVQIKEAEFMRKTGNTPKFPFNGSLSVFSIDTQKKDY